MPTPHEITAVWENDTLLLLIEEPQEPLNNTPQKTHTLFAENICCVGQAGHNTIVYIFHLRCSYKYSRRFYTIGQIHNCGIQ